MVSAICAGPARAGHHVQNTRLPGGLASLAAAGPEGSRVSGPERWQSARQPGLATGQSNLRPRLCGDGPIPKPGPQRPRIPESSRDRATRGPGNGRWPSPFPQVSPARRCGYARPRPSARGNHPAAEAMEGIHGLSSRPAFGQVQRAILAGRESGMQDRRAEARAGRPAPAVPSPSRLGTGRSACCGTRQSRAVPGKLKAGPYDTNHTSRDRKG